MNATNSFVGSLFGDGRAGSRWLTGEHYRPDPTIYAPERQCENRGDFPQWNLNYFLEECDQLVSVKIGLATFFRTCEQP
jgi:hypothetical protein